MRRTIQEGTPRTWSHAYPLPFYNAAGEAAPAYACLQVIGSALATANTIYTATKPTGGAAALYVFSAPSLVDAGEYGSATDGIGLVLISGTPVVGQEIGPTAGSWALSTSGKGFIYLGGLAGGVGRAASKGGTTAGDDFPIVRVTNNTGLPLLYGSIVGYGTPLAPPPGTLTRLPTWYYAAPTAGKPFAVTLADIPNTTTGDAAPVGVVSCQINLTDANHTYADCATNDNVKLASGQTGTARILWREKQAVAGSGTLGVQWAIVLLGAPSAKLQFGEVYTTISAMTTWGTPGTGSVKFKNDDGTDDGGPVNVANYYKHSFANGDTVLCDRGFSTPRVYADKGGAAATGGPTRFARAYTAITAATSNRVADWGSGSVKFMDDATGVLDVDPTAVRNPLIGTQFVLNAQVQLESVGGVWKVKNGTCGAVAWL